MSTYKGDVMEFAYLWIYLVCVALTAIIAVCGFIAKWYR